jgi:hypothetical protein
MASNGIDFTGDTGNDSISSPSSTQHFASRGAQGPVNMTGDGASDVGGTIGMNPPSGDMPPKGSGVEFTGDVGHE